MLASCALNLEVSSFQLLGLGHTSGRMALSLPWGVLGHLAGLQPLSDFPLDSRTGLSVNSGGLLCVESDLSVAVCVVSPPPLTLRFKDDL